MISDFISIESASFGMNLPNTASEGAKSNILY